MKLIGKYGTGLGDGLDVGIKESQLTERNLTGPE